MHTHYTSFTHIGKRPRNEDAICPTTPKPNEALHNEYAFVLCDGVGGKPYGHEASRITAQTVYQYLKTCLTQQQHQPHIETAIEHAIAALHTYKQENMFATGLYTTLAACYINPQTAQAHLYHLGDSRIYLFRNQQIYYQSQDHNLYNAYLKQGLPVSENSRLQKQLTRVIRPYEPDENIAPAHIQTVQLLHNDTLLLCSDGVNESFTNDQLLQLLTNPQTDIAAKTQELYHRCLQLSNDNFSAFVVEVNIAL